MSFHIFCYGIFTTVMLVSCASDMKHRSRIDIISQILEAANGGNATKTKIMYKTFLSYDQLKDGLTVLTEKDLLRYDENTPTFKITEKGRKVSSNLPSHRRHDKGRTTTTFRTTTLDIPISDLT